MVDYISTYYMDNPVEVLDKNQRTWYDPDILLLFKSSSVFTNTVSFTKNLGDERATTMVVSQVLPPHPNFDAVSARTLWLPAMHIDSRSQEITFNHYAGKVAYDEYSDLVTYWKASGQAGLRAIINAGLGNHIVEVHDLLARNAYLSGAINTTGYLLYSGGTSMGTIDSGHVFDIDTAADIQLGMKYRDVAGALNQDGTPGAVLCYTTPGVIFDIQKDLDFLDVRKYADPSSILRYEVGSYKGVRFIESPRLTLWNCGSLTYQFPISVSASAGDGSPNPGTTKVDGVYQVGQTDSTITHTLTVTSNSAILATGLVYGTAIAVGDIVTIHKSRTSAYGSGSGVDPFAGANEVRRVVAETLSTGGSTIALDKPLMEDFATALTLGNYGWITKGRNVHASIFVGAPQAIVAGVCRPIRLHTPPPIDDLGQLYRFSWSDRIGYQAFNPEVFEVVLSAGSTRVKGARVI